MEPKDPTWDDTGFEPEEDGFMRSRAEDGTQDGTEDGTVAKDGTEDGTKDGTERRRVDAVPPLSPLPEPAQRRKKGAFFWLGIVAGLILFIALIGGGYYYLNMPSVEEQAFMAPEAPPAEPVVPTVDTAAVGALAADTVVDSLPTPEPLFAEAEPPAKPEMNTTAKPKKPAVTAPTAEPEPVEEVKPTPKPVKRPATPTVATTPAKSNVGAMWVVQVFSSPSRDDADEWLQTLREKRVQDGYIVEQQLRGQPWYRVRFGQFSTREDAEAAAVNLGFRQPWIARIR